MVVPYANRAAVASLPSLALASKPATVKEVIEDFAKQVPHERAFECVQLIKGRTIRVVFPSAHMMEEMVHTGLTLSRRLRRWNTFLLPRLLPTRRCLLPTGALFGFVTGKATTEA